jgi:hypothetical protein
MTAREVTEAVARRVQFMAPGAKAELAAKSTAVWLSLPNGQSFEIKVTEMSYTLSDAK